MFGSAAIFTIPLRIPGDETLVINPGPCALGYHALLEIRREGEAPTPTVKASLFSL
jgi:Icc-related predicted phosphoesterase